VHIRVIYPFLNLILYPYFYLQHRDKTITNSVEVSTDIHAARVRLPGGPKSDTLFNYVSVMPYTRKLQNTRDLYCLNNSNICY